MDFNFLLSVLGVSFDTLLGCLENRFILNEVKMVDWRNGLNGLEKWEC